MMPRLGLTKTSICSMFAAKAPPPPPAKIISSGPAKEANGSRRWAWGYLVW